MSNLKIIKSTGIVIETINIKKILSVKSSFHVSGFICIGVKPINLPDISVIIKAIVNPFKKNLILFLK